MLLSLLSGLLFSIYLPILCILIFFILQHKFNSGVRFSIIMGKNCKRNCGNVCSICNHKECALYLYNVEQLKKMLADAKRLACLSSQRLHLRQIKMTEAHLKELGEKIKSWWKKNRKKQKNINWFFFIYINITHVPDYQEELEWPLIQIWLHWCVWLMKTKTKWAKVSILKLWMHCVHFIVLQLLPLLLPLLPLYFLMWATVIHRTPHHRRHIRPYGTTNDSLRRTYKK